jgi:phosphatidylethanolamine-binding protein (PEBP) family uncharacterized protein
VREIPEGWDPGPETATVTYNDFVQSDYGGPSPPDGAHDYHFKLFAIDSELELPAGVRKARIGSKIGMEHEILGQTQLIGEYHAEQGSMF